METLITIGTVLGGAGALVAAGAAIFAAIFTYRIMQAGQKQVELSQEQLYDQQRPVLAPVGKPVFQTDHDNWLKWDESQQPLAIRNIGAGTAFNVASVLYGCASYNVGELPNIKRSKEQADNHWTCWLGVPIAAGENVEALHPIGTGIFADDNKHIGPHPFNAPDEPSLGDFLTKGPVWKIARLTITYHDIFGRKHASIFDYVYHRGWDKVDVISAIERDLHDLEGQEIPIASAIHETAISGND